MCAPLAAVSSRAVKQSGSRAVEQSCNQARLRTRLPPTPRLRRTRRRVRRSSRAIAKAKADSQVQAFSIIMGSEVDLMTTSRRDFLSNMAMTGIGVSAATRRTVIGHASTAQMKTTSRGLLFGLGERPPVAPIPTMTEARGAPRITPILRKRTTSMSPMISDRPSATLTDFPTMPRLSI